MSRRPPRLPSALGPRPGYFSPAFPPPFALRPSPPRPVRPSRPAAPRQSSTKTVVEEDRTGIVANYSCSEGYGFITVYVDQNRRSYDSNLFVHHSGLLAPTVEADDVVKFDVAAGKKGFEAINVKVEHSAGAGPQISQTRSTASASARDRRGEVIEYNVVKRYGIVKSYDSGKTLLAHHAHFKPPLADLEVGQIVRFDIVDGPKGPIASQVAVVSEAPPPPESVDKKPSNKRSKSVSGHRVRRASQPDHPARDAPRPSSADRQDNEAPQLSSVVADASAELQCCMCIDLLALDSVQTPCEHYFCRECIDQWLRHKTACPLCKKEVKLQQLQPLPRVIKNLIEKARSAKTGN